MWEGAAIIGCLGYHHEETFDTDGTLTINAGSTLTVNVTATLGGSIARQRDAGKRLDRRDRQGCHDRVEQRDRRDARRGSDRRGYATSLGTALAYAGASTLGSSATLDLGGYSLTLSGAFDALVGGTIEGTGSVVVTATASLPGLTLAGGAATLERMPGRLCRRARLRSTGR